MLGLTIYFTQVNVIHMQHKGEVVEKAVRESGFPIAELARRMKKSRRHIYNMFENPNLSLEEILKPEFD